LPKRRARRLDRHVHARLGAAVGGVSVIGLAQAWADWAAHLALSPGKQMELAWKAARKTRRLGEALARAPEAEGATAIEPLPQDRRFDAPEWQQMPYRALSQGFLMTQQWWTNATTDIPGMTRENERMVEFFSRQWLDMLSPANFLATNPQLIEQTLREGGANLARGAGFLLEDAAHAFSEVQTGTSAFRAGHEVAVTPGKVVYRNHLIELIQYAPQSDTVHAVPLLIVPAWIMKYYILDLSAENSLIGWLVGQGFTVFCISWKNPDADDRDLGFDDYREAGVMTALDAVTAITGARAVHALGYCLGGTLLAVTAAAMARDSDDRLASVSMLAAQVDFSEAGELSIFTTAPQVALLEDMMWEEGYLDQKRMAGAFNMLRSQDLIWSRMTREYLMGERDHESDLSAWSHDATRMPYRMHSQYLRRLFLGNDLAGGRFEAGGEPVFLADIRAPVFAVASEADHIAPWHSVFKLTHLLHGDISFALVSGGHNSGIISAPTNPRARYRLKHHLLGSRHESADEWAASVASEPGSWWPVWAAWLQDLAPGSAPPPPMGRGEAGYGVLTDAPGDYVRMP